MLLISAHTGHQTNKKYKYTIFESLLNNFITDKKLCKTLQSHKFKKTHSLFTKQGETVQRKHTERCQPAPVFR